jgi:hypothetical protein
MTDIIDDLLALDDAGLNEKLGYTAKVSDFKKDLSTAASLPKVARAKIAENLKRQLEPNIYPSDLHYDVERAQAKAAGKTTPDSVCCGCVGD